MDNEIPDVGPVDSSIQIAPPAGSTEGLPGDVIEADGEILELGDRIQIVTENRNTISGRIYYRDADLIRILPDGISNRLFEFPLEETGEFAEDAGVTDVTILEKHHINGFVNQQNLRPGQLMDTFDTEGRLGAVYKIKGANDEDDWIDVEPVDGGAPIRIEFNYIGIPRDMEFVVIGTREAPQEDAESSIINGENGAEETGAVDAAAASAAAEAAEEAFGEEEGEEAFVVIGKITLPTVVEVEEIPSYEQVFPAHIQKSDALNGFMELMSDSMKKDPRMLRRARALTEMFFGLKNEFIVYDRTGRALGAAPTSVETLVELFRMANVPLGRPVLDTIKRIYTEELMPPKGAENEGATATAMADFFKLHYSRFTDKSYEDIEETLTGIDMRDFWSELYAEKEDSKGSSGGTGPGAAGTAVPTTIGSLQYWIWLQIHMNKYNRPWRPTEGDAADLWDAKVDAEFFRKEFPDIDADGQIYGSSTTVKQRSRDKFDVEVTQEINTIPFALDRALGPTYRTDEKKNRRLLKAGESAPIKGYVLFPIFFTPNMGAIRSGLLARDVEYSSRKLSTMRSILRQLGGVSDIPTSNGILALGLDGNTLGNIPVADYLSGITFTGLGMGSFDLIRRQFGLDKFEINMAMHEVLQRKMAATQNMLRVNIDTLRTKLEEFIAEGVITANDPLFGVASVVGGEETASVGPLEVARSEPMLERTLHEFSLMSPNMAHNDIALTAALLSRNPDLFTAVAAAKPVILAAERLRAQRASYAKSLESAKALRELTLMKGEAPKPNTCKHVELLRDIRREDDAERMRLMTVFISNYSGTRDANWINCKNCKEHLICMHELLQLKIYHQPREKQAIMKELLLNFNGPLVSGKYQCRNCGQPISELDYDTALEYDDAGRPMMGRAALDTSQETWEDQIEKALEGPITSSKPIVFENETQQEFYEVAKVLADTIGVPIKEDGYLRIIAGAYGFMAKRKKTETREIYAAHVEKLKKRDPSQASKLIDYDARMSRFLIGAVASYTLLEVQTAIPNYVIRFQIPGCKYGFTGYPIGNVEDFTGMDYISCAVSSIRSKPVLGQGGDGVQRTHWEMTGWHRIPSDKDRIQQISELMKQILEKHAMMDPTIQNALGVKRQYVQDTFGSTADIDSGRVKDQIPIGYLPAQIQLTPEEVAAAPIIAESAGAKALAELHIMTAHKYARKNSNLVRGSPFSETICCTVPISEPRAFWEGLKELPPLPARALQASYKGSRLSVHFRPRPPSQINLESPQHLYYRVFLNVCFSGPNIGRPHELGFSHKCFRCGFQFPASLFMVRDYIETTGLSGGEAKKEKARRAEELREAERQATSLFASAGVTINAETFQQVLDASHLSNRITPYSLPPVVSGLERIAELAEIEPAPASSWDAILKELLPELARLTKNAELADKALAVGSMSNEIDVAKGFVLDRMESSGDRSTGETVFDTLERMDPFSFMEAIHSYFITPFQRLLTQANPTVETIVPSYYGLGAEHSRTLQTSILMPAYAVQTALLKYYNNPKAVFARMKLMFAVQQLGAVYTACKKMNAGNTPGGEYILKYIYHYFVYSILALMLDPNSIPPIPTAEPLQMFDTSAPLLTQTVVHTLRRLKIEQIALSPEEIREAIKVRTEKENELFIRNIDKRSDDEKRVTMIMKNLRIGEWAVGQSKAIYKYDADRWETERLERMNMGFIDYSEGAEIVPNAQLEVIFNYGDEMVYTAAEGDGYDNAQYAEDDF